MKRWLAIFLIMGVLSQSMGKLFVYINYQLNQDYIATHLCVNRDKPMSCCHGKCHLSKQLNKTEDGTKGNTPQRVNLSDYVSFCSDAKALSIIPRLHITQLGYGYKEIYSYTAITYIAHPPTA